MDLIVHFKVEMATKVCEGITRYDSGDSFTINNKNNNIYAYFHRFTSSTIPINEGPAS